MTDKGPVEHSLPGPFHNRRASMTKLSSDDLIPVAGNGVLHRRLFLKQGLMLATAGLAAAYAAQGVRVVGVNPGLTRTERVAEGMIAEAKVTRTSAEEALARAVAKIPLGRLADPREIADTVVYLASGRASYVTGVTVSMDGASAPVVV